MVAPPSLKRPKTIQNQGRGMAGGWRSARSRLQQGAGLIEAGQIASAVPLKPYQLVFFFLAGPRSPVGPVTLAKTF